jgi:hypothetical protein
MASKNIIIEGARIGFRNFSGAAGRFNAAGVRNFCVFLENDLAKVLEEDGWNVRWLPQREEDDAPQAYMQVAVNFDHVPPKIVQITRGGKTQLTEQSISQLDVAQFSKVDLSINPYAWEVNGKSGVKAYLKALYVTLAEDELEAKYADYADRPDSAYNAPATKDDGN